VSISAELRQQVLGALELSAEARCCVEEAAELVDSTVSQLVDLLVGSSDPTAEEVVRLLVQVQERLGDVIGQIVWAEGQLPIFLDRLGRSSGTAAAPTATSENRGLKPIVGRGSQPSVEAAPPASTAAQASTGRPGFAVAPLDPREIWGSEGDLSLVADKIAAHGGSRNRTVRGVDDEDLPEYLEDILRRPGYKLRTTSSGSPRIGWWDPDTGTMVIREGNRGTFMQPDQGYQYFLSQLSE
jgi:hypothetical protein